MKSLFSLLFSCLTAASVLAAGSGDSSTGVPNSNANYHLKTGNHRQKVTYAGRLQDYLLERHPVPDFDIETLSASPINHQQLEADLDHDHNLRRFLYLGHTKFGKPDMVLAAPLGQAHQPDGARRFVLLTAKKPRSMESQGFVKISNPKKVMDIIDGGEGPGGHDLIPGHVLNMHEIFDELGMLKGLKFKGT